MKAMQLREMTIKDINAKIIEARKNLAEMRLAVIQGSEKNVSLVGKLRREIAILNTVKRDKEIKGDAS